jgi:hydroxyacylglutathione hydrolase
MIRIIPFVFNPFQENTYLIYDETGECVVLDAGCHSNEEKSQIQSYMTKYGIRPVKLINSHCHIDHILGNNFFVKTYGLTLSANQADEYLIVNAISNAEVFGLEIDQPPSINVNLNDGDSIRFGKSELNVIHVPGHTPGCIALYSEKEQFVMVGDTLFEGSIGRTDLPGGNHATLINSIQSKLLVLPDQVKVYPGHGRPTSIGKEIKNNPFLK